MRPDTDNGNRWRNYVQASSLEPPRTGHSEKVSPEWLEQHNDLNSPWLSKNKTSGEEDSSSLDDNIFQNSKKRQMWYQRIQVWICFSFETRFWNLVEMSIWKTTDHRLILDLDHASEQPNDTFNSSWYNMDSIPNFSFSCWQFIPLQPHISSETNAIYYHRYYCWCCSSGVSYIHYIWRIFR